MKKSYFICPETREALFEIADEKSNSISHLVTESGITYPMQFGIPDFTFPKMLNKVDETARSFYEGRADDYDKYLPLTFKTHNEDELSVREGFIDCLGLKGGERVLDLACGTGRDSELIAQRLGDKGQIFCQDISVDMLKNCVNRLEKLPLKKEILMGNAVYLPFEDNFFDAVYSFGGLGEFSDIRASLKEMARVTKVGGKIVVGDESMPPWLKETEFAKILITTNPQFNASLPLAEIPVEAREVQVRWVIGGVFYLIEFRVGDGEPTANFDFEIPGSRGGTYRSRYEGQMEGVSPEVKELAYKAVQKKKLSMHKWLDKIVKDAALKDLNE